MPRKTRPLSHDFDLIEPIKPKENEMIEAPTKEDIQETEERKEKVKKFKVNKKQAKKIRKQILKVWGGYPSRITLEWKTIENDRALYLKYTLVSMDLSILNLPDDFLGKTFEVCVKSLIVTKAKLV